jgi:hypothetical protein
MEIMMLRAIVESSDRTARLIGDECAHQRYDRAVASIAFFTRYP